MYFEELTFEEQKEIDGGVAASAILVIASGVCYIGAGVAALTGHPKIAAGCTIVGGACDVAAGIALLLP